MPRQQNNNRQKGRKEHRHDKKRPTGIPRRDKKPATRTRRADRQRKEEQQSVIGMIREELHLLDWERDYQVQELEATGMVTDAWRLQAQRDFYKHRKAIREKRLHRALMQNVRCNDVKGCRDALVSCLELVRQGRAKPVKKGQITCMAGLSLMPQAIQQNIISMRFHGLPDKSSPFVPGVYVRWCGSSCLCVLVLYPGMKEATWGFTEYWCEPPSERHPRRFYSTWGEILRHVQEKPGPVPAPELLVDFALDRRAGTMPVLPIEGSNNLSFDYGGRVFREEYALVAPF
ncbi:expressed unknown protein [Seminavis robusta]|uniref:Uncharacterized protein n=1 Tax=Seminavis robusta TaxID=568900 RepID=A0A9N8HPR6_9STRA|nr:expressed unknown protein [Seminavis robusta]|eukprot:Sro1096_g240780.1 n/a (288) ;mRNA; f:18848-19711